MQRLQGPDEDPRSFVQRAFEVRKAQNPNYSQRAFARDLAMSTSHLCDFLGGKRGISPAKAQEVADQIGLTGIDRDVFLNQVEARFSDKHEDRQKAMTRMAKMSHRWDQHRLSLSTFSQIKPWYHLALLELCQIENIKADPRAISQRLSIEEKTAKEALERLISLNLLTVKGSFLRAMRHSNFVETQKKASQDIRFFHCQVLDKAKDRIVQGQVDDRFATSRFLSLTKDQYERVTELIQKLEQEAGDIASDKGAKPSLYCLSMQLFDIQ